MKRQMLDQARTLSCVLKRERIGLLPFASLCGTLSDLTDSNVYILDKEGEVLGGHYINMEHKSKDMYRVIIPIGSKNDKVGDLYISRHSTSFRDADLVLAEFSATVLGIKMQCLINLRREEQKRMDGIAKTAMSSLSYSEREGIRMVFEDLDGCEGIIVISRVADRARMARTVIVNAIRKFESAGIIESKSLGMKGTYIRVVNKNILVATRSIQ